MLLILIWSPAAVSMLLAATAQALPLHKDRSALGSEGLASGTNRLCARTDSECAVCSVHDIMEFSGHV